MMLISSPSCTDCSSTVDCSSASTDCSSTDCECERDEDSSSSSWWRNCAVAELADLSAACACDSAVLPCQLPLCSGGGDACDAMMLTVSPSWTDCSCTDCVDCVCDDTCGAGAGEESESWWRYMLVSPWADCSAPRACYRAPSEMLASASELLASRSELLASHSEMLASRSAPPTPQPCPASYHQAAGWPP
jgi:hypothetical protein